PCADQAHAPKCFCLIQVDQQSSPVASKLLLAMQADFLGRRFYVNAYLGQQQALITTGNF
ncbi:hypothetical protein SB776_40565, partial [Burkholderia sp. SIMBA_045]